MTTKTSNWRELAADEFPGSIEWLDIIWSYARISFHHDAAGLSPGLKSQDGYQPGFLLLKNPAELEIRV